jgi:hypothetical protein
LRLRAKILAARDLGALNGVTRSTGKKSPSNGSSGKKTVKPPAHPLNIKSPYLSAVEAAFYLRVTARALEHFRCEGGGPSYRKHGGSVVYHLEDLDCWSLMRRYSSTSKKAEQ